jgi:hypothetical protein
MLKSDAPLLVNPKLSWHKISWFEEFMGSMTDYEKTPSKPPSWPWLRINICLPGPRQKTSTSI